MQDPIGPLPPLPKDHPVTEVSKTQYPTKKLPQPADSLLAEPGLWAGNEGHGLWVSCSSCCKHKEGPHTMTAGSWGSAAFLTVITLPCTALHAAEAQLHCLWPPLPFLCPSAPLSTSFPAPPAPHHPPSLIFSLHEESFCLFQFDFLRFPRSRTQWDWPWGGWLVVLISMIKPRHRVQF